MQFSPANAFDTFTPTHTEHTLQSILSPCPGLALIDASEAMKELGEVKDALDMEVKQNFIDPLQNLHDKDLKEIQVSKTLAIV